MHFVNLGMVENRSHSYFNGDYCLIGGGLVVREIGRLAADARGSCHGASAPEPTDHSNRLRQPIMTIRNGLYSIRTKLLDGVDGGQTGVSVLRNGKMLGGGSVLYHFGSYHCSGGKWKGEVTSQEHTPTYNVRPFAGHIASMGFAGTYTDEGAEFEATALVGKRSLRLKTIFRLLIADE